MLSLIWKLYRGDIQQLVNYCCDRAYRLGLKRGYDRGWQERGQKEA